MPRNNLRQADVPKGGEHLPNPIGTAPGLKCDVVVGGATKVVYAVPGVPYEMVQMVTDNVLPDLLERAGERAVIVSRSLKTWGASESGLAELIAERVDQQTNPTIAFLARGVEGIYVRMTAKAATEDAARALLDAEDAELRSVLGELVFAVDDETMESEVLRLCEERGWTLGVAESLTGGFIGARLANVPGASRAFKGSVASYATSVKRELLGVTAPSVVSEAAAAEMAAGAQRVLGADVAVAVTGVAGPDEMEGRAVGTVCYAVAIPGRPTETTTAQLPGDRERIRQFSAISSLNLLRMRLLGSVGGE
jgi:nicotinamide-nucleotide amidase